VSYGDAWQRAVETFRHYAEFAQRRHPNLVTIARAKSNRTFSHQFQPEADAVRTAGHPRWYGDPFALSKPEGRDAPDESLTRWETSVRGKRYRVEIQAWYNFKDCM
jgi:hypothetical protein